MKTLYDSIIESVNRIIFSYFVYSGTLWMYPSWTVIKCVLIFDFPPWHILKLCYNGKRLCKFIEQTKKVHLHKQKRILFSYREKMAWLEPSLSSDNIWISHQSRNFEIVVGVAVSWSLSHESVIQYCIKTGWYRGIFRPLQA